MNTASNPEARADDARAGFDPIHLPILGEPLVVEFANTWYSDDGTMIDFLATREMVTAWFTHAPDAAGCVLPDPLTDEFITELGDLRNSIHAVCTRITSDVGAIPRGPVAALNHAAAVSAAHIELRWTGLGAPTSALIHDGAADRVLIAELASQAITLFAGPDRTLLRQCATPTCELLFVARHHRRRFCSEPCSQRTRQSRYYRSHHFTDARTQP